MVTHNTLSAILRGSLGKLRLSFVFTIVVMAAMVASAQATAVPLVIDTNAIFSSANSWIVSFTPIFAIGIGIAIAITILGFIGSKIVAAFKGGSK